MNILLIGIDNAGLITPIVEEMRQQGHVVTFIENGEISRYDYLHPVERISNLISKALFKRNLKQERSWLSTTQFLNGFTKNRHFDITILTNPDIYTTEHLTQLKKCTNRIICHLWDSTLRMPNNIKNISLFDKVLSFDPQDVKKYGFTPVTNYYKKNLTPLQPNRNYDGDVFGIFSFDRERYAFITAFLDANPDLKIKIMIYVDHHRKIKKIRDKRIEIITKPITGDALLAISSAYHCILDIGYQSQKGLSFRFFESLAYEQKIISNNNTAETYPFFHPNNIFCITDTDLKVSPDFLTLPYHHISDEIKNQYRLDIWVNKYIKAML